MMNEVHAGLENKEFATPEGLKPVSYCMDSGLLATDFCKLDPRGSRVAEDQVFPEDFPEGLYCTAHTAESTVKLCKDCPILDETGAETGLYYVAGPYCPEESLWEVCLPDYQREPVSTAVALDEQYRYATLTTMETCTVHGEPELEDPLEGLLPWLPEEDMDPDGMEPDEPSHVMPDFGLDWLPW